MNICDKYYWITDHPKLQQQAMGTSVIEITPHMVCPETNKVEEDQTKNTKLQFWVELMIPHFDEQFNVYGHAHDWELDTGGDTWEEAVESLYNLVLEKYGDYTEEDVKALRDKKFGDFNFDEFMDKNQHNTNEKHEPLTVKNINELNEEIANFKLLLEVEYKKLKNPFLSIQDAADIEMKIICLDADIFSCEESLRLGYLYFS